MPRFSIIEYSGKDAADVLINVMGKSGGVEIIDVSEHHAIGFVREEPDDEHPD